MKDLYTENDKRNSNCDIKNHDQLGNNNVDSLEGKDILTVYEELQACKERERILEQYVLDLISAGDEVSDALKEELQYKAKMTMELGCVENQNKRYRNAIDRIKNTWYGKICYKIYVLFFRK